MGSVWYPGLEDYSQDELASAQCVCLCSQLHVRGKVWRGVRKWRMEHKITGLGRGANDLELQNFFPQFIFIFLLLKKKQ
jgi:hypothetical protein